LIAPVDTTTPVPLLYYVCTLYIVRYNFPKTHPSQPTYAINALQKEKRKTNEGGFKKKTHECGSGFGLVPGYTTLWVRVRANIKFGAFKIKSVRRNEQTNTQNKHTINQSNQKNAFYVISLVWYLRTFLSVNQLSLQSGKVCSGKLERILLSINFSSEFPRIHAKETQKWFDPTKAKCCKLVKQRGKTRSSTFQAGKRCTGKLSVAN